MRSDTYRTSMETMVFILLILAVEGLAVGQSTVVQSTKMGFVGESALLPCPCSNDSEELAWQIGDKIVSHYPQDKNDNSIDKSYINRTQLFLSTEKSNCSLLLINLSLEDAAVYTCHVLIRASIDSWSRNESSVNLTVSENKNSERESSTGDATDLSSLYTGVSILVVVVILAAVLLLRTWVLRRGRKTGTSAMCGPSPVKCSVRKTRFKE